MRPEPKLRRVQHALRDPPPCEVPRPRLPRAAHLVEVLLAAHDQRALHAAPSERLRERRAQRAVGHAEHDAPRARGVEQRPEQVEQRAEGQRLAVRRDLRERGVEVRREEEGERRARDVRRARCRRGEGAAERLEEVGGPRGRGGGAPAVLRGVSDAGGEKRGLP